MDLRDVAKSSVWVIVCGALMGSALTEELDHSERFRSDEEDHPNEV